MTAWSNRKRIVTAEPLPREPLVLTFIEGKLAAVNWSQDYEVAKARAEEAFRSHPRFSVKVLPVTFGEAMNFMRFTREEIATSFSEDEWREMRARVVQELKLVLREENDAETRQEAYDLLVSWGEMEP